jgi:hypothetical protein
MILTKCNLFIKQHPVRINVILVALSGDVFIKSDSVLAILGEV